MPVAGGRAQPRGGRRHGRRPGAGLALVDALERAGALDGYHLLPATRADLLRRSGRTRRRPRRTSEALELVENDAERTFLVRRLVECRQRRDTGVTRDRRAMDGTGPEVTRALVEERMPGRGKLARYERVRDRLLDGRTEQTPRAGRPDGPYRTLMGGIAFETGTVRWCERVLTVLKRGLP